MKIKMRNPIYTLEKFSKNDNSILFNINFYDWGLGFNIRLGDSRRFFNIDLLFLHLEMWF